MGEVLHEAGIIGDVTEAGAVTHGATEAGAVIHGEPIHEVLVITEEAVIGPKQKKRKYTPD